LREAVRAGVSSGSNLVGWEAYKGWRLYGGWHHCVLSSV
jgi:hypothetical protein